MDDDTNRHSSCCIRRSNGILPPQKPRCGCARAAGLPPHGRRKASKRWMTARVLSSCQRGILSLVGVLTPLVESVANLGARADGYTARTPRHGRALTLLLLPSLTSGRVTSSRAAHPPGNSPTATDYSLLACLVGSCVRAFVRSFSIFR